MAGSYNGLNLDAGTGPVIIDCTEEYEVDHILYASRWGYRQWFLVGFSG